MFTFVGNGYCDPSPILDEAVCISQGANILGKDMNSTILPPDMNNIGGWFLLVKFDLKIGQGKLNSNPLNSAEKLTVSHPA